MCVCVCVCARSSESCMFSGVRTAGGLRTCWVVAKAMEGIQVQYQALSLCQSDFLACLRSGVTLGALASDGIGLEVEEAMKAEVDSNTKEKRDRVLLPNR
jgi:hypothetical protein